MMSCIVYYKYYARSVRDAIVFLSFWHFNSCERAKRIRICYVWTRIFLQTEGKNLRFQKYPDTCGLGLRLENTIYNVQSPRRNRPLPSSKNPHFQNEVKGTTFLVKMIFICMRMKNDFHIKGSALNLVLIQRPGGTGKWSIVLLNNKTFNFCHIKKHPSIQFSPLIDALLSLIKYKINMVRFRLTDCIVKINANWRKSGENDYVKKNLHAKEPLNRNHGDQNKLERGRPIIVADYKNGSNHQINAREIKHFAKRTFLC